MAEVSRATAEADAEVVRTETADKSNTAARIGQRFADLVDSVVWNNKGLAASRPGSSSVTGDHYFATDTGVLSIWDGSDWQDIGAGAGVTLTAAAPENVTKAAASAGVSAEAARADHKHDIATAAASTITDSTNSEGASTSLARADHGHSHGNRGGGALHAVAIAGGANGFMSGSDKTKVDALTLTASGAVSRNNGPFTLTPDGPAAFEAAASGATPGQGNYGGAYGFSVLGDVGDTHAAIVAKQTGSDEDNLGIAIVVHSSNTHAVAMIEAVCWQHDGSFVGVALEAVSTHAKLGTGISTAIQSGSVVVGNGAGAALASGSNGTTLVGSGAGLSVSSGASNTYAGNNAGNNATTGSGNTGVGSGVLPALTTGNSNTALGNGVGATLTTGSGNTLIGVGADVPSAATGNWMSIMGRIESDAATIFARLPIAMDEVASLAAPGANLGSFGVRDDGEPVYAYGASATNYVLRKSRDLVVDAGADNAAIADDTETVLVDHTTANNFGYKVNVLGVARDGSNQSAQLEYEARFEHVNSVLTRKSLSASATNYNDIGSGDFDIDADGTSIDAHWIGPNTSHRLTWRVEITRYSITAP